MGVLTFVILLASVLVGFRLLVLGRRGRVIDDHPVCAKCRFDLSGRADDSDRCPECGFWHLGTQGIETGNRQTRQGLLYTGIGLMAIAGLPLAMQLALLLARVDSVRAQPLWWLLHEGIQKHSMDGVRIPPRFFTGQRTTASRLMTDIESRRSLCNCRRI